MGCFFFIAGPDKMLLGADVKGLIKARPTPALLPINLFLFAWRSLLDDHLDLPGVVFMPICHLLPLDGIVLPQIIKQPLQTVCQFIIVIFSPFS
jgi:hypothetical protein